MFPIPTLAVEDPIVRDAFAFIAAACGQPSLMAALAGAGYGPWDHRRGCSLLRSASMFVREGAPDRDDATAELSSWVASNRRLGRAAPFVLDPEAADRAEPALRAEEVAAEAELDLAYLDAFDEAVSAHVAPPERPDRDRARFLLFFAERREALVTAGFPRETPLDVLEAWRVFWLGEAAKGLKRRGRRDRGRARSARPRPPPRAAGDAPIPDTVRSPCSDANAVAPTDRAPNTVVVDDVDGKEES